MTEEKCSNCRFWQRDDEDIGMCRRFPPVFLGDRLNALHAESWEHPSTSDDNWCGEWQPAKGNEIKRVDISAITTLSGRNLAALRADGFLFVDQIQSATDHELMLVPNFGKLGLKQIRDWQAERVAT